MPIVAMPDGVKVRFPDDMPTATIRSLITSKYPNAQRDALDKTGVKPYQNVMQGLGTALGNIPAQIGMGMSATEQAMAEGLRDVVDPNAAAMNPPVPPTWTPNRPVDAGPNMPPPGTPGQPGTPGRPPGWLQQAGAAASGVLDSIVPGAKVLQAVGPSVVQAGLGLIPGAKEAISGDLTADAANAQKNFAHAQQSLTPTDMRPGSWEDYTATGLAGAAGMAPGLAASIITKSPAPMMAQAGIEANAAYGEARQLGLSPEQARQYASAKVVPSVIGASVSAGPLLKEGVGVFQRVITEALVNTGVSASTEMLSAAADLAYTNPALSAAEIADRVKKAAIIGGVTGGALGGMAAIGHGKGEAAKAPDAPIADAAPVVVHPTVEDSVKLPAQLQLAGPGPQLRLPAPAADSAVPRRPNSVSPASEPGVMPSAEPTAPKTPEANPDYQAQLAVQKTRQVETKALLDTARQTITPLGSFSKEEAGGPVAQRVGVWRSRLGMPIDAPITVEDMARAGVPQPAIDALVALRRPLVQGVTITPSDVVAAAEAKNLIHGDANFKELAYRTTGSRDVATMSQTQLNALRATLDAMPAHETPVTVPIADRAPFDEGQYSKAVDAVRAQGRYTLQAIKDATGLKGNREAAAVRDAMVRRGQLVQRSPTDFRLYDVLGAERQPVPDDVPIGVMQDHVVRELPVNTIRIRQDGKSLGSFNSAGEARAKIRALREAEASGGTRSQIAIEPGAETAHAVLQNRYDAQGNLLGQVPVSTHRTAAEANAEASRLNTPDTGPTYTQTDVTPASRSGDAPVTPVSRKVAPAALAGRMDEILGKLNQIVDQRKLGLLGAKVRLTGKVRAVGFGDQHVEGAYTHKLITVAAGHLDPSMSTDEVVHSLAGVIDHELVHALKASGVLGPETEGWRTIVKYAERSKRPGSSETYTEFAQRHYAGKPGYETRADIEEEAIAEAFRHWAANRRNVAGKPATVFSQIVQWFKNLRSAVPNDIFSSIESGKLVEDALRPPGAQMPRAEAARAMAQARADIAAAEQVPANTDAEQAAKDNLLRVKSRAFLHAREQAREDRAGRSGPKTVLGTTPSAAFESGDIMPRADVNAIVDRFKADSGTQANRLQTYLPLDPAYMNRVADAQEAAKHTPDAPGVAKAYSALTAETKTMFKALGPLEVSAWTGDGAPYADPAAMLADVKAGRLKLRLSRDLFGPGARNAGHPMHVDSGYKTTDGQPLSTNDLFRIVHDVYGHGQSGFRNDPRGAYNAYHEHARLLSPEARRALATETLAQDAWASHGPHLRRRDGTVPDADAIDYLPPEAREFAQQKAFVLPDDLLNADPGLRAAALAEGVQNEENPKYALAYHGTPHKVDKFSNDKIGTGEGAQAFGWGLYFAGKKEVANYYRKALVPFDKAKHSVTWRGQSLNDDFPRSQITDEYAAAKMIGTRMQGGQTFREAQEGLIDSGILFDKTVNIVRGLDPNDFIVPDRGNLYKVDIPDDHELLNWDKPLSDQPPSVKRGLQALGFDLSLRPAGDAASDNPFSKAMASATFAEVHGKEAYKKLAASWGSDKAASGALKSVDIPGHKFLDATSRDSTGEGTHNYVIYDDNRIKVLEENPKFSLGDDPVKDDLPGGRFYGKADRSPGGVMTKPETPSPQLTVPVDGAKHFGGPTAEAQLEMARTGEKGATMLYLSPAQFEQLSRHGAHPEQEMFNALAAEGYKFRGFPSLVVDGYAGAVRVADSDAAYSAHALAALGVDKIPVVVYPKRGESLGLVTALEGPNGRLAWPGAQEFDPAQRNDPISYDLHAAFSERVPREDTPPRWAVTDDNNPDLAPGEPPAPLDHNIVQQRVEGLIGRAIHKVGRSKTQLPFVGSIFDARTVFQDKMLSIKELVENLKAHGGNVNDTNDSYMLEQLYHGKVFEQIQQRENSLHLPLLNAIRESGVPLGDLETYLYARHVPERNAYLRTRGAKSDSPAGLSDKQALAQLDKFAKDGKTPELEKLAQMVYKINADTTRTRVEAGLISQKAADSSPYKYYVSLRGNAAAELDPDGTTMTDTRSRARSGKGFSVGGREERGTTGRFSEAKDIISHVFLQNIEATIRAEKNRVAQSFLRLVNDNPNAGVAEVLSAAPTRLVAGDNGMIRETGDPSYRQDPSIVTAKVGGREIIMRVADERVARAIKSDYVTASHRVVQGALGLLGTWNRYMATVTTSLSPDFLIKNPIRDMLAGTIIGQQYDIKGFTGAMRSGMPQAMNGIREVLFTGKADGEWAKAYQDLKTAGGTVEFMGIHDLTAVVRRVQKSVENQSTNPTLRQARDMITHLGDFVDNTNKVLENSLRLSAFVAARKAGVSTPQAAYVAKNITVNFNKGGELKSVMNSLYLFYGAGVQGTAVMLNALKNKRVQKMVAGIVVAGAAQDVLNRLLPGDKDANKNGVPDYDEIDDYTLEHNLVVRDHLGLLKSIGINTPYFKVPLPMGFNVFWNLGRNLAAVTSGSPKRTAGAAALNVAGSLIDAYNPLGGANSLLNFISPTITDPLVDLAQNRNFAGAPIVPERPSYGPPQPNSQKYWANTSEVPIAIAQQLNSLTGGNAVRPGKIDLSPETLQYLFDYATGATGTFFERAGSIGTDVLRGDLGNIKVGSTPLLRSFVGDTGSRDNTQTYYENAQAVQTLQAEMKSFLADGNTEAYRKARQDHPLELKVMPMFDAAEKTLAGLRKQLRDVRGNDKLPATERHARERAIQKQQDTVMAQANQRYFTAQKAN